MLKIILPVILGIFLLGIVGFEDAVAGITPFLISDQAGCESVGGTWSTPPDTCTFTTDITLNADDDWRFLNGVTVKVNSGVTITNNGILVAIDTLNNFGTISGGFGGLIGGGTLNNEDTINNFDTMEFNIINNFGTINDFNTIKSEFGIINNFGTIIDFITMEFHIINNFGNISNFNTINFPHFNAHIIQGANCGTGTILNTTTFECVVDPTLTVISTDTVLETSTVVNGSVIVQSNSILTIPNGVTLTIPTENHLRIEPGSGVLIKLGGTLKIIS